MGTTCFYTDISTVVYQKHTRIVVFLRAIGIIQRSTGKFSLLLQVSEIYLFFFKFCSCNIHFSYQQIKFRRFFFLWAVSTQGAPGPKGSCLVSLSPPAGDLDSTVCGAARSAWPVNWPKHQDTTEHPPPKMTEMVKLDELLLFETVVIFKWSEQERMANAEIS